MVKVYAWNEIKDFLIKEFKKTKHIMTFGTVGSCNIEHDIDIIITKKPTSNSSAFYKEVHKVFDALDDFLSLNYKGKLLSLPSMTLQAIANYLNIVDKSDLKIHVMIYFSYQQFKKDNLWSISKTEKVEDMFSTYSSLFGEVSNIFSENFAKEGIFDNLFIYLYTRDVIHSHLPLNLKLEIMNPIFDFILRKRLKQKTLIARNDKDLKAIFYAICDKIDEASKK